MDAREFLGLQASHNPYRWYLPVTQGISTPGDFLFGGSGLAAAIEAMERTTGRPVVWATAQYLSYARPGSTLDIDVIVAINGHRTSQARAVGHVADREILTVNAALGSRPFEAAGQWEVMPEVPSPDVCPARPNRWGFTGTINDRLDLRMAKGREIEDLDGTQGDGRTLLWARVPEVLDMSAAALAILGDYVPFGVGQALGLPAGGNSLDNTLRVLKLVQTEWVLMDIQVHGVDNGFGHGLVHLWAEDGTLLATASQSCLVRFWTEPPAREEA